MLRYYRFASPEERWDYLHAAVCAFLFFLNCLVMRAFLSNEIVSGWDIVPLYHLVEKMSALLGEGKLTGYDFTWFAGYPIFTFYAPLFYIFAALPSVLSGGLIQEVLSLNIWLFCLPLLFTAAIYLATFVFFSKRAAQCSTFLTLFMLYTPRFAVDAPIGVFGSLLYGNVSNFFAVILFVLFLSCLERDRIRPTTGLLILQTFLFSCILLSHTLTSIFTACFLLGWFIAYRDPRAFLAPLFGGILAAPWLIDFLSNIDFTSGQLIAAAFNDPLAIIIPGIIHIRGCYASLSLATLFEFPVGAILLGLCGTTAIISMLRRGERAFVILFLTLLLLLPRNLLSQFVDIPVHYYRMTLPLAVIFLLLSSKGLADLISWIHSRSSGRATLGALLSTISAWACLNISIINHGPLFMKQGSYAQFAKFADKGCAGRSLAKAPQHLDTFKLSAPANAIIEELRQREITGRVAAEMPGYLNKDLGSPHFFNTILAKELGVETFPGLLAESALSTSFINAILGFESESMRWGKDSLIGVFHRENPILNIDSVSKRFAMWGTEYIVAISDRFIEQLQEASEEYIEFAFAAPPFNVFRLKDVRPKLSRPKTKPLLFVNNGGLEYRDMAEIWYSSDLALDTNILFTPKTYEELSAREQEHISGFVISVSGTAKQSKKLFKKYLDTGKTIVVFGSFEDIEGSRNFWITAGKKGDKKFIYRESERHYFFLASYLERRVAYEFGRTLASVRTEIETASNAVEAHRISESQIEFEADGPVVINYNYFPRWRSLNDKQTVFMTTPSVMYVLSDGKTSLEYR